MINDLTGKEWMSVSADSAASLSQDCVPRCHVCGAPVSPDEIGLTRKMTQRAATKFFCVPCLALHFQVSPQVLREKIIQFKEMGCTLFSP